MGKKTIALLGVAVSAAFIYFCVENKKDTIALKCSAQKAMQKITGSQTEMSDESIEEVDESVAKSASIGSKDTESAAIFEKSDPAFGMTVDEPVNVVGMFAPDAKEGVLIHFIDELCSQKECLQDLRYSDDIKKVDWGRDMIRLIQYMMEAHIEGGSVYVNSNILHIEGKIADKDERRKLDEIIASLKKRGLGVEDKTTAVYRDGEERASAGAPSQKSATEQRDEEKKPIASQSTGSGEAQPAQQKDEERIIEVKEAQRKSVTDESSKIEEAETVAAPAQKSVTVPKEALSSSSIQKDLDLQSLEKALVTEFSDRENRLTPEGEKDIDRIAELLHAKGAQKIGIEVFVHQGDDQLVNIIVAQKRANILKNALLNRGFSDIVTNGAAAKEGNDRIEIKVRE